MIRWREYSKCTVHAMVHARKRAAQAAPPEAGPPRKLTLAEQIAATRAKAGAAPASQTADADAERERFRARLAAQAEADRAEAAAEARAEAEAKAKALAEAQAAEAAEAAAAEAEAAANAPPRPLTLAEKIAATRAKVAQEQSAARAEARVAEARAEAPPSASVSMDATAPLAAAGVDVGERSESAEAVLEVPAAVQAAVDAGRVDEVAMLLGNAPNTLRLAPGFKALKKRCKEEAEAVARLRAVAKAAAVDVSDCGT